MITILTPSYNRGYIIDNAYKSLLKQKDQDFEWIIIDDGSADDTKKIVDRFIKDNKIKIRYFYKKNGGKHTALNYGIKKAKGEYILILDSDDILTEEATEKINYYFKKYSKNKRIAAISFLRITPDGKKIGKKMNEKEIVSNNISYRYNRNMYGDMAEVYKKEVLEKYSFPVFENERFLSEAIVWNKIALDYDTVYVNKGIYITEYLNDGLSKNFFKLVYNNPIGASENSNLFMIKEFKLMIRIKNAILYNGYSLIAKKTVNDIINHSNNKLLTIIFLPAGFIFYILMKLKFKKN